MDETRQQVEGQQPAATGPQSWPPTGTPATQAQYSVPPGHPPGGSAAGAPPTDQPPGPPPGIPPVPPPGAPQYGPPAGGMPPYCPPPPPQRGKSDKTVIGIVIGIVAACVLIPLIGIVATIAIPLMLSARNNAINEQARNSLRTVASAEAAYYAAAGRYGSQEELVEGNYLDARFATGVLDDGITVTVDLDEDGTGYFATVNGRTETYTADESGEIQSW